MSSSPQKPGNPPRTGRPHRPHGRTECRQGNGRTPARGAGCSWRPSSTQAPRHAEDAGTSGALLGSFCFVMRPRRRKLENGLGGPGLVVQSSRNGTSMR